MIKRTIAIILIWVLCIGICPITSFAEEADEFATICIEQGKVQQYSVIRSGEDILMSGEDLETITGYSYNVNGNNATFSRGCKTLRVDLSKGKLYPMEDITSLRAVTFVEKVRRVGNTYYFSCSQMLPWMNVVSYQRNGIFCVLADAVSIWDFIEDFHPEDFEFRYTDCCQELGVDSKWLKAAAYVREEGFGMILDVIPATLDMSYGSYMDYYEIFDDLFKNKESSAYAFKELTGSAAEIKSAFDLIDKLDGYEDLPDELKALSAFATALEGISDAADFAVYYMTFQEDNDEKLEMMESIALNRINYEYPEAMVAAAMQIGNDYRDIWQGLETKLVYLAGENAFDGLVDSATGMMNTALELVGATTEFGFDWTSAINRISKYEAISACCLDVIERSKGSHQSTLCDLRCHAQLYLYSCEQNWRAMATYAESKDQLQLAEKYLIKAEEALAWQGKFLAASIAQENDSHEYGDGIAKTQYTEDLLNMFSELLYLTNDEESGNLQYDTSEILPAWYFKEYDRTGIKLAVLADVTHDDLPELITVVCNEENMSIEGGVYTVNENGDVEQIEALLGSEVHAGGFFGWYLKKVERGYNLIQETFGMWQGYGEVDVTEYYLDAKGNRTTVNYAGVSSGDSNPVTDEAWICYVQEGGAILDNASLLYKSATNIGGGLIPLDENLILERANADINVQGSSELASNSNDMGTTEIVIEWDGKYPGSNELINLNIDIKGTLNDGSYIVSDGTGQLYDLDGEIIGVIKKEISEQKGTISICLYGDGLFEFEGYDANYIPVNYESINAISYANATAYVKVAENAPIVLDSESGLYRSHTGYWFWGICGVHNGIVREYDSSWIIDLGW